MTVSPTSVNTSYRADIDGLRAVSILAVVAYHAGIPWLAGGYVGVDVFFVISGYLITGLLLGDLKRKGRIDFAAFYARRVRRLLPAASLVVVVTVIGGALLLSPALGEVQAIAKSALATLLIVANLYYLRHSRDYFAETTDQHPLLHAWSLSIEEQFYLVWPAVMLFGWKVGTARGHPARALCVTFAIAFAGSALFALVYSAKSDLYAFYLMPARAWELGAGAMVAVLAARLSKIPAPAASGLSVAGILLIAAACVWMTSSGAFPFPLAIIPVLGAVLVIAGNLAAPQCTVARLLATRFMVTIGLASYAWYLWHWPILTIARIRTLGQTNLLRDLLLVAVSLLLALLTLRYVERPLRYSLGRRASPRRVLQVGAIVTGLSVLFAGSVGWLAKTLPPSADEVVAKRARSDYPKGQAHCHASVWPRPDGDAQCLADEGRPRIFLWGDSHADHWSPALHAWSERVPGEPAIEQWTLDACPPLFDATPTAVLTSRRIPFDACREFNESVRRRLATVAPRDRLGVVLASNWWYRAGDVRWKRTEPAHSFDFAAVGERESLAALERYLTRSLQEITAAGYPVLVILQSPVLEFSAPECILRRGPAACAVTLAAHRARADKPNATIRQVVDAFPTAHVFDPATLLCDGQICPATFAGNIAYTDRNHLTASVTRALVSSLEAEFQRLSERASEAPRTPAPAQSLQPAARGKQVL